MLVVLPDVQRLLQTVDAKSVLFIVMDDLINDPLQEYQRVLESLDVPYDKQKSVFHTQSSYAATEQTDPKYDFFTF